MSEKKYSKGRSNLRYRGNEAPGLPRKKKPVRRTIVQEVRKRPTRKKKSAKWLKVDWKHKLSQVINWVKKRQWSSPQYAAVGGVGIILLGGVWVFNRSNDNGPVVSEVLSSQDQQFIQDADFPTIDPAQTDTQTDRKFDPERNVFQYKDTLEAVSVIVTQQPLPDDIRETPSKIKNIALSTPGTTKTEQLQTDKGVVYVSSADDGTQVCIFSYDELLIFINSQLSISLDGWLDYINGLK